MEKKLSVGIFSRSDKNDYAWLVTLLSSSDFSDRVQDVKFTVIYNSGFQQFVDNVYHCSLGILYHTKNRGRVNITDIPGSLYNEELEILNQLHGKDNVIVVIDDVEDSSDQEKSRILKSQTSIEKLACDLILISKTEKKHTTTLIAKLKTLSPFRPSSAQQGISSARGPVPQSGRHNLEEKLPDIFKTKLKTEDLKPLRSDNTEPMYENLKPWKKNMSLEVSLSHESQETWNAYSGLVSTKESLTPWSAKSEMPSSNTESCIKWYNVESQKISTKIESSESVTPNTLDIYCVPKPQLCNEKPRVRYSSETSEKLSNKECSETQFRSITTMIECNFQISEKLPNKGCPTTQFSNETSKMGHSSENSTKLPSDELREVQFYNNTYETWCTRESSESKPCHQSPNQAYEDMDSLCRGESKDTPVTDKSPMPKSAHQSPQSQSSDGKWSQVVEQLKLKQKLDKQPQQQQNSDTA